MQRWFGKVARKSSEAVGSPYALVLCVSLLAFWIFLGPVSGWSDTWQLVANTTTTIATTLIVVLIQHTQNVNEHAMQKKLDELITHLEGPRDEVAGIERDDS